MLKQNLSFNQTYTLKDPDHDEIKDGYQLRWVGKNYAKLQENLLPETVIVPDSTHNSQDPNKDSQNLFLTGDNLEVLKHLEHAYTGKVDMIYIDPPYNTGSDGFVYNDDFGFTDDQLRDTLGLTDDEVKRIKNLYGKSSHSAWLTFMYPRLKIAKKLLKDTGVIFVSIDDNEQANLKLLMDEVFNEGNFVGVFCVENNPKGRKNSNFISVSHEYCVVYAKDINASEFNNVIPKDASDMAQDENGDYIRNSGKRVLVGENFLNNPVKNFDSDKHYSVYFNRSSKDLIITKEKTIDQKDQKLLASGYQRYITYRENYFVENTYSEKMFHKLFAEGRLNIKDNKIYEKHFSDLIQVKSVLTNKKYEAIVNNKKVTYVLDLKTTSAKQDLDELMGGAIFDYPKNVNYIKTLISLNSQSDSLILDFFAGSGTTAHAVMDLNKQDQGNRRYIMCTLDEKVKEGSEAEKAGYKTIDEISRERIKRAAKEIGDKSGLRHYRFVKPSVTTLDKIETFDPKVSQLIPEDMVAPFSEQALTNQGSTSGIPTILTTWLIDDGYDFSTNPQPLDLAGYTAYYAPSIARLYLIEKDDWTSKSCKDLLNKLGKNEISVNVIVVYPYSFNFVDLTELKNNVKANLDGKPQIIERY